jgi:hypothetical protein
MDKFHLARIVICEIGIAGSSAQDALKIIEIHPVPGKKLVTAMLATIPQRFRWEVWIWRSVCPMHVGLKNPTRRIGTGATHHYLYAVPQRRKLMICQRGDVFADMDSKAEFFDYRFILLSFARREHHQETNKSRKGKRRQTAKWVNWDFHFDFPAYR